MRFVVRRFVPRYLVKGRQDLERIMVDGEAAFVTYRCVAKDGKSFRNTEFFTFTGDRIGRIDVYFGATYQHGVFVKQQG